MCRPLGATSGEHFAGAKEQVVQVTREHQQHPVALFRKGIVTKLALFEVMPVLGFGATLDAGKYESKETLRAIIL